MPAFHECRVFLIFALILTKNETAAARFKASESLCLLKVDRLMSIAKTVFTVRTLVRESGTVSLPADYDVTYSPFIIY